MLKKIKQPKSGEYYLGKVRGIGSVNVSVSIFATEEEYVAYISREKFPQQIEVGSVFKYLNDGKVQVVQPRELSPLEIEALRIQVDGQLPINEF